MDKDGGIVVKIPILHGTNYDSWKPGMEMFINSLGNKSWKNVVKGWEPPKVTDGDGKVNDVLKPKKEWNDVDEQSAQGNSKVLNSIFNGVHKNIFKLIKIVSMQKYHGRP